MEENILHNIAPYCLLGELADGTSLTIYGTDEEDCMYKLLQKVPEDNELVWYGCLFDETHEAGFLKD